MGAVGGLEHRRKVIRPDLIRLNVTAAKTDYGCAQVRIDVAGPLEWPEWPESRCGWILYWFFIRVFHFMFCGAGS